MCATLRTLNFVVAGHDPTDAMPIEARLLTQPRFSFLKQFANLTFYPIVLKLALSSLTE